jgi:hydroxyacylglutathione hydrolase
LQIPGEVPMLFKRIKSEGLAHNSYFIGTGSSAVVIDPRRDVQIYLELALNYGMKIKYILETHRNEDFVIGSLELGYDSQAPIYHGPGLEWKYGNTLKDGQEFIVGRLKLTAIHTPGHTDESMSFLVTDLSSGKTPVMLFTGDTIFVGDTGRVDLYGNAEIPRMSSNLYDSIFKCILPLGDHVILCPAHGAGSVCGLNIADRDESTLGIERLQNPSLQHLKKDEFARLKSLELPERPPYFEKMEKYNLEGPPQLSCLPMPSPLTPSEFKKEIEKGSIVVDTSLPSAFGGAHILGSYSIWLEGLPGFAGWMLPYDKPILLVLEDQDHLKKAVTYLIRVGYDNIIGFLKDGIEGWYDAGLPTESLPLLSVHQLKEKLDRGEDLTILDARDQREWESGHIQGSLHIYVGHVESRVSEIPRSKPVAVVCSVGHRAGIAASVLLKAGFPQVYNVLGSVTAWRRAGFPLITDAQASEKH